MGAQLAAPVAMLHAAAFALGYVLCKIGGFDEKTARTVSIETGERPTPVSPAHAEAGWRHGLSMLGTRFTLCREFVSEQ